MPTTTPGSAAPPPPLPTLRSLRPLLMLLLFFAVWSERAALQAMADATSSTLVQLAAACGDPNR
jgi:hypothetical protein